MKQNQNGFILALCEFFSNPIQCVYYKTIMYHRMALLHVQTKQSGEKTTFTSSHKPHVLHFSQELTASLGYCLYRSL